MDDKIIETLSYFDIFDFPLTFAEIKKYTSFEVDVSDQELYDVIDQVSVIQELNGYYYFLGRSEIVNKRQDRTEISIEKISRARVIVKILSVIPTIQFIGLSGSLSMGNAHDSDDIDLFFITQKNTLWLTRFLVVMTLSLIRQKRGKHDKNAKNKVCPNMFMDEGKLSFSERQKTLYMAHEIVQLRPLYDKNESYTRFMAKNKWVNRFFPNIKIVSSVKRRRLLSISRLIQPFEYIAYVVQKKYMERSRTNEVINKDRASFHPNDRQKVILDMFKLRAKRYKKLYMENLWSDKDEVRFYMDEKKIRILN